MYENTLLAHKRFNANMRRVKSLISLAVSNEGQFKPVSFWTYEGISADLFRVVVVLMHAAVEDLVRDHVKKNPTSFTYSGASDIFNALKKSGYDTSGLEDLRKPLQQFALRRHRIVHYGDLNQSAEDVEQWSIADVWQLTHWHIAVVAFLYRFLEIVTQPTDLFTHRYDTARKALNRHADFGRELVSMSGRIKTPITSENLETAKAVLDELQDRLQEITQLIDEISK